MDVVLHQRETADAAVADLIFVVELATLSQTFAQLLADAAVDVVLLHQRETADAAVADSIFAVGLAALSQTFAQVADVDVVLLHQRETADAAVADSIFAVGLAELSQTFAQLLADAAVDVVRCTNGRLRMRRWRWITWRRRRIVIRPLRRQPRTHFEGASSWPKNFPSKHHS